MRLPRWNRRERDYDRLREQIAARETEVAALTTQSAGQGGDVMRMRTSVMANEYVERKALELVDWKKHLAQMEARHPELAARNTRAPLGAPAREPEPQESKPEAPPTETPSTTTGVALRSVRDPMQGVELFPPAPPSEEAEPWAEDEPEVQPSAVESVAETQAHADDSELLVTDEPAAIQDSAAEPAPSAEIEETSAQGDDPLQAEIDEEEPDTAPPNVPAAELVEPAAIIDDDGGLTAGPTAVESEPTPEADAAPSATAEPIPDELDIPSSIGDIRPKAQHDDEASPAEAAEPISASTSTPPPAVASSRPAYARALDRVLPFRVSGPRKEYIALKREVEKREIELVRLRERARSRAGTDSHLTGSEQSMMMMRGDLDAQEIERKEGELAAIKAKRDAMLNDFPEFARLGPAGSDNEAASRDS